MPFTGWPGAGIPRAGRNGGRTGRRRRASGRTGSCRPARRRRARRRSRCRAPVVHGSSLELAGRVVERGPHLVLDVGRVGAVVAAQPPGGGQVGGALHVLGQAGRPAPGQDAAPGRRVTGAGQHEHAVADRADRPAQAPEPGDPVAAAPREPRYWRIPARARRAGAARRSRPAPSRPTRPWRANSGAAVSCSVERLWLGLGAELAEQHAGRAAGVGGRDVPASSVAKTTSCPASVQHPPRHRDLGDVEVPVRQRNQHTHHSIVPDRPAIRCKGSPS